jgi:hypothetical protein
MSARILRFPRRAPFTTIKIARHDGEWLVIAGPNAWDFNDRESAWAEACRLADGFGIDVEFENPMLNFGPWAPGITPAERLARLRAMRAFALLYARPWTDFIDALARAETDPAALDEAADLLVAIPALTRRRMLASYQQLGSARSSNGD